jgi:hypothetical protein
MRRYDSRSYAIFKTIFLFSLHILTASSGRDIAQAVKAKVSERGGQS